jgi:glc operon protein GlcG
MKNEATQKIIQAIVDNVEELLPVFLKDDVDRSIGNGNCALVIIDEGGAVTGKIFGTNKIRGRESFRVAWTKASQVWITGYKTGEYEKKVFNDEISDMTYGISKPDLIGWEGGQPVTLKDGTKLSCGFSGMRGIKDLEIVVKAIAKSEIN